MRYTNPRHPIHCTVHPLTRRVLAISAAAWLVLACVAGAAPPGPGPQVGTNLGFLSNNAGEWPFVDVFKTSSRWYRSGPCGWDCGTLALDADGWVTALDFSTFEFAHTFIFTDVADQMPHGDITHEYIVLYDGVGFLDYDGSAEVVSREQFTDAGGSHGRDVVRVDPASSESFAISIILTARTWDPEEPVDPSEYVRNIRVIAPGGLCSDDPYQIRMSAAECPSGATYASFESSYDTQIFHPTFLDNARNFGVIRLMDWMDTIDNDLTSYSQYPREASARWNPAPATIMAKLANRLGADLWINIPHLADEDFLMDPTSTTGLAVDLAGELDESRKLYVEYSNEVWNPEFDAFLEVAVLGCDTYPDLATACDNDEDSGNGIPCEGHLEQPVPACDTARTRYTSQRSLGIWEDFEDAFDNDVESSSASRLVRVLSSWSGHATLHDDLLSYQEAYLSTDAFAVGAYFGWPLAGDPIVQTWDASDAADMTALFGRLATEVDDTLDDMEADRLFLANTQNYSSIPLVFYEGGQGLVAWGPNADDEAVGNGPSPLEHANEVFDAANRDSRMGERYQQLLSGWRQRGGDVLFNHYVNCHAYRDWGRYGALEHQRQDHSTSPKYSALMSFIAGLP